MHTRRLSVAGRLDLRRTLAALNGRFEADGWWLAARTPTGPGSIRISRTRDHLVGDAWGEGREWLLERLGHLAGLGDDPETFETDHPVIARLHRSHLGWRFGRTDLVFDSLVVAVCGQKVTGAEASAAMRGLRLRFGERAPGPNSELALPPDPRRMAEAPYWEYHELHLEKRRADILRRIAASHETIEATADSSPVEAARALESIDGIGVWSAAKTIAVSHGDPDQVAVGDFHIKHMVVHHLTGRDRGTDEEMLELLEPFRPHRGRVVRLLHTLGHEPKFGPRMPARDITGM